MWRSGLVVGIDLPQTRYRNNLYRSSISTIQGALPGLPGRAWSAQERQLCCPTVRCGMSVKLRVLEAKRSILINWTPTSVAGDI